MMRRVAILIGALALSACSSPAASNGSGVEPVGEDHRATAVLSGSGQTQIDKGVTMRPIEILIASDRAQLSAKLADNEAARALAAMLPLKIQMRDHLRQEKTGILPLPLPGGDRRAEFSVGTLGLWGGRDFVIYYQAGQVPAPGIVILGHVQGDLSVFDNSDGVTISLQRAR
jgi:hypothetical protein